MKNYTNQEILEALKSVSSYVEAGDSIQMAVKKVTNNTGNTLARKIRHHPLYLHILNKYVESRGYPFKYIFKDGKLKSVALNHFD